MDSQPDIQEINARIATGFARITADLSALATAGDLLEAVLRRLEETFAVPFVWVSLIETPEITPLAHALREHPFVGERLGLLPPESFHETTAGLPAPLLANGPLRPFYRLFPPNTKYFVRSLALTPLTLGNAVVGSINCGDASPERYRPDMDTTLLEDMGRAVSRRLAEILAAAPPSAPTER